MAMMKQIFISMWEDSIQTDNDVARISLKAFQLYNDYEEGRIENFGARLSALTQEIKDVNSNWDEVSGWLAKWKDSIEANHKYLIIDHLDNCIQTASNLGFEDEVDELHDALCEIEVNINGLVDAK